MPQETAEQDYGNWSGIERKLAPVSRQVRFVYNERDLHLQEMGYVDLEEKKWIENPNGDSNFAVAGAGLGLGDKSDQVYGFAVSRDKKGKDGKWRKVTKTYCGPFHRSLIGELTISEVRNGEVIRMLSPEKLCFYLNTKVFEKRALESEDFRYKTEDGKIDLEQMIRCYLLFTRLAVSTYLRDPSEGQKGQYKGVCYMCGEEGYAKCDGCGVKIRKLSHGTPKEAFRQMFISLFETVPQVYDDIAETCNEEVFLILLDQEEADFIVPTTKEIRKTESQRYRRVMRRIRQTY